MIFLNKSFLLLLLALSFEANALVDYSETVPVPDNKLNGKPVSTKQLQVPSNESKSLIWKSDFAFNTNYESLEIASEKIGVMNLNTHLQTPFNVYLDLAYWNAHTSTGYQSGNPKAILGFNWFRFGSPSDETRLDIYGGVKLPGSSQLASSRTDKIFGIETTKHFGTLGLGLGYDMTLVGTPKRDEDMSIGKINRITLSGGWMVSNDIQFELEVENFDISPSTETSRASYLMKGVSFSTLSPKLNLTIAPAVNLELGARFSTKRVKSDQDLAAAKLFDLHGVYSNSLFVGLNLNL